MSSIITKFLYFCFSEMIWVAVGTFCGGASFLAALDKKLLNACGGAAGYGAIIAGLA